jgi:hypothetical protein
MIKNILLALSLSMLSIGDFAYADSHCKADKEKYCSQCEKKDKSCVKKCMKENKDKLSEECKKYKAKSKDKRSKWDKTH